MPLFNFKYQPSIDPATLKAVSADYGSAKIIISSPAPVVELGNRATMYKNVVIFYIRLLLEGEHHAINLIKTLEKEYHLK
jgi:hypothetical protein